MAVSRLRQFLTGAPLLSWAAARVVVLGALALSRFLAEDLGARAGERPLADLLGWDAAFYRAIAAHGYDAVAPDGLRFFPLLPLLARVLALALGGNTDVALLLVANGSALAAGVFVERLARRESGNAEVAARSAWFLALAPPAFVLVMGYAEPLMIAAVAGGFLALRTRRWGLAGVAGFAAGLSRPLGVLFVVPALIEVWGQRGHGGSGRGRAGRLAAVAGAPLGLATYLGWAAVAYDDALLPLRLQGDGRRRGGWTDPVTRLVDAGRDLAGGDLIGSGLHLVWAIGFLALLVVLVRKWPLSIAAFSAVVLVAALSARNIDSLERYAVSSVGFVLAAASLATRPVVERLVYVFAGAVMTAYATLAFLGAYVP